MPEKFSLRGLRALSKRLNDDPSLIENDWRQPFYETFDLATEQKEMLDKELEEPENNANGLRIQEAFREAANVVRNGGQINFRVNNDLDLGRRVLRLEIMMPADATTHGEEVHEALALVCCCAHCGDWHWCWESNPCPPHTVKPFE